MRQRIDEYPELLRQQIVREVLAGQISKQGARDLYNIKGKSRIVIWVRNYLKYGVCSLSLVGNDIIMEQPKDTPQKSENKGNESQSNESALFQQRIKQLEKQLENERLLKEMYVRMIEIAEQEHKISIRKKTNTK
jgi:transposase